LTTNNLVFLLLKTVLDCISRLVIFSTFMFVVNDGQFSTMMTVTVYYTTVAVLMAFNMIINSNENYCSAKTWIEIVLNSLSSVLSYNNFDFEPIFSKKEEKSKARKKIRHEPTVVKQTIYFLIMTSLNLGLTIATLESMTPNMRLIDVNGFPHELTEHQVKMMITIGWLTFLAAWVMNICFYKTHPSAVDFSPKRFKDKMFIYIFGKKYNLICSLSSCLGCTTCSDCRCSSNSEWSCATCSNCCKDDQGDSDYYQKKETNLEMGERGHLVAQNDIQ